MKINENISCYIPFRNQFNTFQNALEHIP